MPQVKTAEISRLLPVFGCCANSSPASEFSPASGDRTHKTATSYDEQGRVWRSETFSVNTSSGTIGSSLKTDNWYDRRGNVIKTSSPGGLVTKNTFDGAGRQKATYFSDGGSGGDSAYADADDVTGDKVLEERHNTFDLAGNVLLATSKLRFHDATATTRGGGPKKLFGVGYGSSKVEACRNAERAANHSIPGCWGGHYQWFEKKLHGAVDAPVPE